jgi:hypothetical protein
MDAAFLASGRWEVDRRAPRPRQVSLRPLYDPDSSRVKG